MFYHKTVIPITLAATMVGGSTVAAWPSKPNVVSAIAARLHFGSDDAAQFRRRSHSLASAGLDAEARLACAERGECLDLYFVNTQLRKLCSSEKELIRKFGDRRGKLIAVRLSELRALPTLATAHKVPHLGLHQLKAGRGETFALKVVDPYRIVLEPAETPVPRRDDGGVALDLVTAVVVLEIIDYH